MTRLNGRDVETAAEALSLRDVLADFDGDKTQPVASAICSLLRKGLGKRVCLVSTRPTTTQEVGHLVFLFLLFFPAH